jgi:TIGR03009 family protein
MTNRASVDPAANKCLHHEELPSMLARFPHALFTTLILATSVWLVDRAMAQPYQQPRDSRGLYRQPQPRQAQQRQTQQNGPYDRIARQPDPRAQQPPAQGINRRPVNAPQFAPRAPFTLTRAHAEFLDKVLKHWEKESDKVKTFQCEFIRYDYDPIWGPRNPNQPKTESDGQLKYAKPDKAMFHIKEIRHFVKPQRPGNRIIYQAKEGEFGEHWVCSGTSIWQYNFKKSQLIEHQLPPEMRGTAISNGPLPFLFGAKAADMKARYWMRVITPAGVKNQIWLEAFPKHRQDRANYERVELILDLNSFLPKALQVYLPNKKNRTVYSFYKTKINDPLGFFKADFSKPKLPRGWQKVVEAPPVARRAVARRPAPRSADNRYQPANRGLPASRNGQYQNRR